MQQENAEHKSLQQKLSEQEKELHRLRKKEQEYLELNSMLREQIEQLSEEKSKLSGFSPALPELIILFDKNLSPLFVSPMILEMLGCTLHEMKTNPLYTYLHKEDIDVLLDVKNSRNPGNQQTTTANFNLKLKKGQIVPVNSNISIIKDNEHAFRYIVVYLKINDQQILDELFARGLGSDEIIDFESDEIISVFRNHKLVYISPSSKRVFGEIDILGTNHFNYIHPEEKNTLRDIIIKRINNRSLHNFRYIYRQKNKNDEYIWLESNIVLKEIIKNDVVTVLFTRKLSKHAAETIHLKSVNQKSNVLKLIRKDIIYANEEEPFLKKTLRTICNVIGYSLIGIALKSNESNDNRGLLTWESCIPSEELKSLNVDWSSVFHSNAPVNSTYETGEVQLLPANDERFSYHKKFSLNRYFKEVCIAPLKISENVDGVMSVYSSKENAFAIHDISFILEIADDISHGIQVIRANKNRRIAEENLRVSEEKYRHLFNNAPIGIFRSTATGRFIELNNTMAYMLGYDTPEEVIENITNIAQQVYAEPGKRQKIIEFSQKSSTVHRYENQYRKLDGSVFYANLYLKTVKDDEGEIQYLEGMLEDITYRKLTEETIKTNEERLKKLNTILNEAESMSEIGSFEWDLKQNVLILSKGWQRIHGFYENRVPFDRIKPLAHPEDIPTILNSIENALKGNAGYNLEHRIIKHDNKEVRYIKSKSKVVFNKAGDAIRMYGSVQDITERKLNEQALAESERKFRFIADATSELICLHDADGTYRHISPSVKRILGYEIDDLIGTSPYRLFHPDDLDRIRKQSHELALKGQSVKDVEYRIKRKDGTYIWFDTYTDLITDESGKVKSLITRSRDITDKVNYQKALIASEEKLRIALEGANADPWELYLKKNHLTFSENWINRLGYTTGEITNDIDNISQIFHKEDLKASWEKLYLHCDGKTPFYESEARVKKKNGSWTWILSRGRVVEWDPNGKAVRLLGINFDISDRKNTEKALLQSEERFRAAFQQDNSVKMIINPEDGRILEANRAAERFYGYSHGEFIHLNIKDINVLNDEEVHLQMKDALHGNKTYFNFKHKLKNDEIRDVEVYTTVIEYNGKKHLFSTIYDITSKLQAQEALKKSEEKYRKLITGMNDGVMLLDHNGKVVSTNPAAQNILGTSSDDIIKNYPKDTGINYIYENGTFFPVEEHPATITLKTGKAIHNKILGLKAGNDRVKWLSINSEPLVFSEQDQRFAMITFSDVTSIKETEQKLRDSNATKDKFFSIIAHDLINPFNTLLGFSKLLQENLAEKKTDNLFKYSTLIHESLQQTYNLLVNLLEWSRAQSGKISFKPGELSLLNLVNDVFTLNNFIASRKNITFTYETEQDFRLFADQNMLLTILRNLTSNAVKYSHEHGRVKIDAKKDNQMIIISVRDNGVGMDKEAIKKLFRIDSQLSKPGTANEKGTGLGLIICKDFVEYHGGKLWVDSELGKGTVFSFSIPVHSDD